MKNENNKNKKSVNRIKSFEQKRGEKGNGFVILFIAGFIFLAIFIISLSFLLMDKENGRDYKEKKYVYTKETPEQVIESSRKAMKNIKTVKFDAEMEVNASVMAENQNIPIDVSSTVNLVLAGYADETDLDNIKTRFNLDLEMDIFSEGGSEDVSLNMDYITIGEDDLYYRLNDYDLGIMGMMLGHELNNYKNKWVMAELPNKRDFDSADISSSLSPKEIDEIYGRYKLLKFEKDIGDEKLENVEVYHYKVKLDSAGLANLIEELQSRTEENGYGIEHLKNEEKEELLDEIFENIEIELWIGKKDKFLRQVKVVGNYDTEDYKRIVSKAFGETEAKKEDSSIKSKMNYVEGRLESHYESTESYNGFSVPSYYAEKIKPENVITNKDSYAIWKEMISTTDKWCVDSMGKSGYVQEEIRGSVCPETSIEPQGEKRNYEEYAYDLLEEEMGPKGKIEVGFDLNFLLSEFNKPLKIEKPKDVEKITGTDSKNSVDFYPNSNLFGLVKDASLSSQEEASETILKKENEISYKSEDIKNGYVMGESASAYDGLEKLFGLFDFLR
ncbi:MAG: hypothetical protein KAQ64_01490 [Candidatus Pacebacteria bacterium]|nr:hypothetical protein [Candidatus Paceibacterota bacterium]